ncbi:carboxylating nicotinate-nucleotide diphosphorylase [Microscilla marina]|uniref:Probable nicotinate-nucleotide pyrophosphorylase [carboxylating] n=1 Tax=Microscilla marina ATCC 23134 TaxID=313606 RepID=A1ZQF8_MICM2|nr:carboxylating nicotinate-nucleotide diphosphorylase [Microscilla marina]EAY27330.1 nicotinate-nucleotide pyrophosphorylase [Microscilla marina ATCC 23134]
MKTQELTYLTPENIEQFIQTALIEDVGEGDFSSLASVPADAERQARLIIKDDGILAGIDLARHIFRQVDADLTLDVKIEDGTKVKHGDIGLIVTGKAQSILKAERLVLNCMQRMSGIATYTDQINQRIAHTKAKLLDTRKTTPNFRMPEKWAVAIGGGVNHRFGLYDMIMLKDNHIAYAGGIEQAINKTLQFLQASDRKLRIEIETQNLDEVREVLRVGNIDVIMLDNMSVEDMTTAVGLIGGRFTTEASGGITLETIKEVAETGVNFISVGALTHSIKSLDISLKAID